MHLPNLNSLRMFDAAARHLNFRRAAEELHLTQGAVAQQVRRLESDLGVTLFIRGARGLTLTEPGANYHAAVHRAMQIVQDATNSLAPSLTRIVLSVPPSFASKWLVPRLPTFAEAYPDIELSILASEALTDFKSDGVDLAVRIGDEPTGADLAVVRLAPVSLCAVCSPEFAAAKSRNNELTALGTHQLIQDAHRGWEKLFRREGLPVPTRMLTFNQTALALDAATNGQGIALAPRILAQDDFARGRLVVIWAAPPERQSAYYIVHRTSHASNAKARQSLIDWLLRQVDSAE
jgi:LysR family glycine cleavage system transcriptional activator